MLCCFARRGAACAWQIYTWPDATLRELADLVKEVRPEARKPQARLEFAFVYPDRMGRNVLRKVGAVWSAPYRGRQEDDNKTLAGLSFQVRRITSLGRRHAHGRHVAVCRPSLACGTLR